MFKIISCPHCGYQYLPGEIFDPKYFLGQPHNIVRNVNGEILGHEGIQMQDTETFICDHCNKEFKVTAKISFNLEDNDIKEMKPISLFND